MAVQYYLNRHALSSTNPYYTTTDTYSSVDNIFEPLSDGATSSAPKGIFWTSTTTYLAYDRCGVGYTGWTHQISTLYDRGTECTPTQGCLPRASSSYVTHDTSGYSVVKAPRGPGTYYITRQEDNSSIIITSSDSTTTGTRTITPSTFKTGLTVAPHKVIIILVGGGGGGGSPTGGYYYGAGGGGGGAALTLVLNFRGKIGSSYITQFKVVVGAGGTSSAKNAGEAGGDTVLYAMVSGTAYEIARAKGGSGGSAGSSSSSGGSGGTYSYSSSYVAAYSSTDTTKAAYTLNTNSYQNGAAGGSVSSGSGTAGSSCSTIYCYSNTSDTNLWRMSFGGTSGGTAGGSRGGGGGGASPWSGGGAAGATGANGSAGYYGAGGGGAGRNSGKVGGKGGDGLFQIRY